METASHKGRHNGNGSASVWRLFGSTPQLTPKPQVPHPSPCISRNLTPCGAYALLLIYAKRIASLHLIVKLNLMRLLLTQLAIRIKPAVALGSQWVGAEMGEGEPKIALPCIITAPMAIWDCMLRAWHKQ